MEWNSRGSKENMRLSSSSSSLKAKLYKASCKNRSKNKEASLKNIFI